MNVAAFVWCLGMASEHVASGQKLLAQLDPELFRCWMVCALVARRDGEHLTGYNLFHIHPQTIDGKAQRGSAQCMPSPMLPRIHVYP